MPAVLAADAEIVPFPEIGSERIEALASHAFMWNTHRTEARMRDWRTPDEIAADKRAEPGMKLAVVVFYAMTLFVVGFMVALIW